LPSSLEKRVVMYVYGGCVRSDYTIVSRLIRPQGRTLLLLTAVDSSTLCRILLPNCISTALWRPAWCSLCY